MHRPARQIIVFLSLTLLLVCGYMYLTVFTSMRGSFFDSNGVPIHYTEQGHGTPVILVHGFAANADLNWRMPGIIDALAREYRVIAMDARAHGLSGKPHETGQYGMNMVDDIARLMDHLEIEKAHLAGYSMGGFLSLAFAGKYSDRLLSLTQGGSGWYPRDQYPDLVHTVPASLDAGTGLTPIVRFMEPPDAFMLEWRIPAINFFLCLMNDEPAMARCFQEMPNLEGTEEQLRTKSIPSLTVMGTKDPLRKSAEFMEQFAANNQVCWIEGADHMTTLGDPVYCAQFIHAMLDFLRKQDARVLASAATNQ